MSAYTPRASLSERGNRGSAAIVLTDNTAQLCAALFDRQGYPAARCTFRPAFTGDACGVEDLRRFIDFARPWAKWRAELTARWVEAFPGSRPLAAYITGEIVPPPPNDAPNLRRPFRTLEGETVPPPDIGWHQRQAELHHLDELGLVDADEIDRALARLESDDATYHGRYRSLARKT